MNPAIACNPHDGANAAPGSRPHVDAIGAGATLACESRTMVQ